ncbi:MAG: flagellin FliC [Deltaproteobacteria bacterium]|nr:flagellin FliC [Deltaproteobacteria bacterium]
MAITINNNIPSLQANRQINKQSKEIGDSFDKLSSGLRINKASADPAGLAVALDLLATADISSVASRNISDGVSLTAIADGALESAGEITGRMSELATQAANGTLSDEQRTALNNEYQQLKSELDRIAQTTEFNDQKLLAQDNTISLQAGTSGNGSSQVVLSLPGVSSSSLGMPANISSQANAQSAIDQIATARDNISQARGAIGASASRFETAYNNLQTSEINQREAASRIRDVDVAQESSNLVANRIREQMSAAMSSQANLLPNLALKLLG